jgi:hypothetical protein
VDGWKRTPHLYSFNTHIPEVKKDDWKRGGGAQCSMGKNLVEAVQLQRV